MKIRKIYDGTTSISDMTKDRVHLDLSYQEWRKIETLVEYTSWDLYNCEVQKRYLLKLAKNIKTMFKNAQDLGSIWVNEDGVAK